MTLFSVPLSQEGAGDLPVRLPGPPAAPVHPPASQAEIVLDYSASRQITINGEIVPAAALTPRLRSLYRSRTDRTLWVAGDGSLRYGEIAAVIEAARAAGVDRVGVITPEMRKRQ
jgi:biopolymer transport protein ExbD